MPTKRSGRKKLAWLLAITFLMMNVIAFFHAYKFTHFATDTVAKTGDAKKLAASEKLKTLFFGVNNPRPENNTIPSRSFQTIPLSKK